MYRFDVRKQVKVKYLLSKYLFTFLSKRFITSFFIFPIR